ncbi:MAG: DUF1007 family protein [Pseudomonadota bacterium]
MIGRHTLAQLALASGCLCAAAAPAVAHPHVFAEARLEIVVGDQGAISELRHVWRFDELFSATVLLEFDSSANLKFEQEELLEVGNVIRESLADFGYFTFIARNSKDVTVAAPDIIHVDYLDGQLLLFFSVKPDSALPLDGDLSFGVYDPTMYTAIDFINDSDLVIEGNMGGCERTVVRPDADEIIVQYEESLAEAFSEGADANDFSKFFATRLELKCA